MPKYLGSFMATSFKNVSLKFKYLARIIISLVSNKTIYVF